METWICRDGFLELYDGASDIDKTILEFHINNNDLKSIREWESEQVLKQSEYGEMSTTQLRKVAYKYSIKNYSRLTKIELIREITKGTNNE